MIIKRIKEFSKKTPIIDNYYKRELKRSWAAEDRKESKERGKFGIGPYLEREGIKGPGNAALKSSLEADDRNKTDEEILDKYNKRNKRAGRAVFGTIGGLGGFATGAAVGLRKKSKVPQVIGAMGGAGLGALIGGSKAIKKASGILEEEEKVRRAFENRRKESRVAFGKKSSV